VPLIGSRLLAPQNNSLVPGTTGNGTDTGNGAGNGNGNGAGAENGNSNTGSVNGAGSGGGLVANMHLGLRQLSAGYGHPRSGFNQRVSYDADPFYTSHTYSSSATVPTGRPMGGIVDLNKVCPEPPQSSASISAAARGMNAPPHHNSHHAHAPPMSSAMPGASSSASSSYPQPTKNKPLSQHAEFCWRLLTRLHGDLKSTLETYQLLLSSVDAIMLEENLVDLQEYLNVVQLLVSKVS
jgi:hypothetical protein